MDYIKLSHELTVKLFDFTYTEYILVKVHKDQDKSHLRMFKSSIVKIHHKYANASVWKTMQGFYFRNCHYNV